MRTLAVLSSIVGVILLTVGFVRYFGFTHLMTRGNISLFTLGAIALAVGIVFAAVAGITRSRVPTTRNHH